MHLQEAKENTIYKVGRNVLLFQQMEGVLKYLVSHGPISGTHSEVKTKFERQNRAVYRSTLGTVVRDFLDGSEPEPAPKELTEFHISFKFEVEVEEGMRAQIEELKEQRNHLIHHFLQDVEDESLESWLAASNRLDDQVKLLEKTTNYLRSLAHALSDGRKELADYMMTEEFKKQFRGN